MKFIEKIKEKQADNENKRAPVAAFLGDSVTQGCFEIYRNSTGAIEPVFDKNCAYHNYFAKILSVLYPSVPVNIINAGISGGYAGQGYERLERDVLRANPDLVTVCFGLNDAALGADRVGEYENALDNIFAELKKRDIDVIFMTPNMINTEVSCRMTDAEFRKLAADTAEIQNDGVMDLYMETARAVCKKHGVAVCDCYKKWKMMQNCGVRTTQLLANGINHPTRDMNWLFALSLMETIMEDETEGTIKHEV